MGRIIIYPLLVTLILLVGTVCSAQSVSTITNPTLELRDNRIHIIYDILNSYSTDLDNYSAGYCTNKTIDCYFWSSTDGGASELWYRHLWYDRTEVYRGKTYWYGEGYSVRCVKDEYKP